MDVVMFGFNDWHQWEANGFRTRCGSIARALTVDSSQHRLLVVSSLHSIGMNAVRAVRARLTASADRHTTLRRFAVREVAPRVYAFERTGMVPTRVPSTTVYRVTDLLSRRALQRAVERACHNLGMRNWVLWVADPLMCEHIGKVGESLSVFDAIDDWTAHPKKKVIKSLVEDGYALAQDRADVIFTVSQALRDRFAERRGAVYWQPNAVDAERFDGELDIPPDLRTVPRPILGYVGVIQQRLDVDLLAALARTMPHASIVLVGPVVVPQHVDPLRAIPNVHLLGERSAEDVPAYVSAFDVCLVPHVDNALTRSMDPLKVYEYLAAGKPVVATGLAEMDVPGELVLRCSDFDCFVGGVRSALAAQRLDGCDRMGEARKRFARSRSWSARLDEMLGLVKDVAVEKGVVVQ